MCAVASAPGRPASESAGYVTGTTQPSGARRRRAFMLPILPILRGSERAHLTSLTLS